jgi:predicted ATPase/GAF domain-containing protein/HPt (histidine-containing phosphotransfer) domain-containing protein
MLLERYEVGELLAESERNTVRRVRRKRDGARLVIKTSTREFPSVRDSRRLEFEYQLLCKLRGPRVISAVELERQGGRVAIVLEDFGGERVSPKGGAGLPIAEFFPLALRVVRAIGEVHAFGVIHKDINPRNILMNPETGEVKLIDFSLSTELGRERERVAHHTGLEGTLQYLSPEQTGRMNRDVDYRSDYYSLGATFFELLTGVPPFSAADVLGYIHCHLSRPAPDPRERAPHVPAGLAALVTKLMSKSPDERYQSTRGLLADLLRCQDEWQTGGDVAPFTLGGEDIPERFIVSQEVLGREAEAAALLAEFEAAVTGPARLLLVAGYSGVGKSTLVSELHRPAVEKRAFFISGKFDPLERNTPYAALISALRGFLKQKLTEPEQRLVQHREQLCAALGKDAAVLLPLLPELGQILGPVPAVAELSAREAQARLGRSFRDLLRALATPAEPLVVFLDDLQWTDGATPRLLAELLGDGGLSHVFFIGAYRDNEVGPGHLLMAGLSELRRKRPEALRELSLAPLSEAVVQRLVASTLHSEPTACAELAALVFQKTAGNPFFLQELLGALYREGAIEFSIEQGAWTWSAERVARAAISDNVVDLMLRRLERLPADARQALRVAACLGNQFDVSLVGRFLGLTPGAVAAALWPAVEQGLLWPRGDAYRLLARDPSDQAEDLDESALLYQFPHDRVTEAAYSLLGGGERAAMHLELGRSIERALPREQRLARVFDYVDHLNLGRGLLSDEHERAALAEQNHRAAQRARRSAAYADAIVYLAVAEGLLSPAEWASRRGELFENARMRVECTFLSGQVEAAKQAAEELLGQAPDAQCRVAAVCLKAAILEQQSHLGEAITTIVQGLGALGLILPDDPAAIEREIGAGIGKLTAHLERIAIEDLVSLPRATDPLRVAAMELLFQLIPAASQHNPPLFILAELWLFDLAVTHGTVPASAKNFMDCGIVLGAMLGDYPRAYRMGKVAFTLLDRQVPTPLESAVNFVFGCFISHWGAGHREGLEALWVGYQRGVELGDVLHASYSIVHRAKTMFFAGHELGDCQAETERALAYTRETGAVGHAALPRIVARALSLLRGSGEPNPDLTLSDEAFTAEIARTENGHFMLVLGEAQLCVALVLGDSAAAEYWEAVATQHIGVGNGAFTVPDFHLFKALRAARSFRVATPDERQRILAELERQRATLAVFAAASPASFAHKHLLVEAELARLRGAPIDDVLRLHREAAESAGEDFVHLRALGREILAECWTDKGHPEFARECLLEAYHLYRHWGASQKLVQMEREHGKWLAAGSAGRGFGSSTQSTLATATATTHVDTLSLDVASAIKSTLAISSEVRPERLFQVLMQTIIENAGAEHGYLLVPGANAELRLAARASVADVGQDAGKPLDVPLESCDGLSQDMVRYVARVHETLVLDDARKEEAHKHDAHIASGGVKSVLCMPILNQGRLLAVLYIENNAVARAFTPARLALLRVIAGQAAVAINNAQLYDQLELRVAERTRQLSEQSREMGVMLNSLEQGVFIIDEQLRVRPRYSAHLEQLLGSYDIAGQDCLELLFAGSDVSPSVLSNMRAALEFSFGGPAAFAEANKSHWVRKFQRRLGGETKTFELDWAPIADPSDAVSHILVALRDVTLLEQISQKAARHARELDLLGEVLDAGVEAFGRFATGARSLLSQSRAPCSGSRSALPRDAGADAARLFRSLHTLKGNARLLGLSELAQAVHAAEEPFDVHAGNGASDAAREQALEGVLAVLDEYEEVLRRKLGDALPTVMPRQRASLPSEIEACTRAARSGAVSAADALAAIEALLRRGGSSTLGEIAAQSGRGLPALALALGKLGPTLQVERGDLFIRPAWAGAIGDALLHVFQNSIDHGIESAEQRAVLGKPAQGTLWLRAVSGPRGTTLRLSDDGAGLDLARLRVATGDTGASDDEVARHIFSRGVTTAERLTPVSGRGVGLDAVRELMRELGAEVNVVLAGPGEGGRRPFELVFELPPEATSSEAPSRVRPSSPPERLAYWGE